VVAKTIEEMGADLHEVDLVTKLGAGRVACAESVLGQILRNLIGNAIKFRARSRPLRITIETRDAGPMVELAVEDNGVGMDPESAKHAFEPFYRGPIDRELPGHGLGLAIVDRTTRSLGGTCELSSVSDHSTRIVVRLPRA
jgi:signal transduction histidine kinase